MGILGFLGGKKKEFESQRAEPSLFQSRALQLRRYIPRRLQRQNNAASVCGMVTGLQPTSPKGGSLPWPGPWPPSSSLITNRAGCQWTSATGPFPFSPVFQPAAAPHPCNHSWPRPWPSSALPQPNTVTTLDGFCANLSHYHGLLKGRDGVSCLLEDHSQARKSSTNI